MSERAGAATRLPSRAYGYALGAVLLWSTVASAFKLALRGLSPTELVCYGSAVATLALGVIVLAQGKWPEVRRTTARQWRASAALGLINPFLYYLVLFNAYARLPGQEAQPLNYTWGIALPLLSVPLLGQRLRPRSLLGLGISFAGVCVIATRGRLLEFRLSDSWGVALALGSSILWAFYWIFHLRDSRTESVKLFQSFLCGFPWTLGALWIADGFRAPGVAILGAAYVGLFEMGVTFLWWLRALALARSTAGIANLIFLAPFVSLVLLRVATGEEILATSFGGLALIVAGIALQRRL